MLLLYLGSHGGRGGNPSGNFLSSGDAVSYGSTAAPSHLGSGGGRSCGGRGGGAIQITANHKADIDGLISANGGDSTGMDCGGGSGGSIFITTDQFNGGGVIRAQGGNGQGTGGGGGGGRISVIHNSASFSGETYAEGGNGGE